MQDANVNISRREVYDAIVVGSGISGGWAAKECTEKGLKTLVLERGRNVEHRTDYVTEMMPPWESPYRGRGDRRLLHEDYYIQSQAGPVNEYNLHFFVNDRENPYTFDEDKPFLWIRGYQVGGRSLMWGRFSFRWSDIDFGANARDGVEIDWPIRYADIAPWYDYVEEFIGVSGQAEGLPQLPDGKFLPPMEMNCVDRMFKEGVERAFPDRRVTMGRVAMLTQPHGGRAPCQYRNICSRGCSYGAYFSSQSSTLPAAQATGNMTLRPHSIVHSIIYDPQTGRASGVRVIDAETNEHLEFYGRTIFLCASALASTYILLNSKSNDHADGMGNSSGTLGHYLMDHHFKVGARANYPQIEDRAIYGKRANGIYVPNFRHNDEASRHPDFIRGYGTFGYGGPAGWERGIGGTEFGADLKESLRSPGGWSMFLTAFGEMLPRYDNYVEIDESVQDKWGMPVLRVHAALSDNERKMREDMAASAAEMLEASGGRDVEPYIDSYAVGEGIHEMGTARMGRDPRTSVLNAYNQVHDVPNVFVTDGACMTSSAVQNPSLTYMALTARAVDHAVREMQNGTL